MEARIKQDLFNKIADVMAFEPRTYNQSQWGQHDNVVVFMDEKGSVDDTFYYADNYQGNPKPVKFGEGEACGTAACVAGWAGILCGWHPTMRNVGTNGQGFDENDMWRNTKVWLTDKFGKGTYQHRYIELEYGFLANKPGICCDGITWNDFDTAEDAEILVDDGKGGEAIIKRVDQLVQELLGLDYNESNFLFNGDIIWEPEDLRLMGKGEDIKNLFDSANYPDDFEDDE